MTESSSFKWHYLLLWQYNQDVPNKARKKMSIPKEERMIRKASATMLAAFIFMVGFNAVALADEKTNQTPPSTSTPQKVVKPVKEAVDETGAPAKVKVAPIKMKTEQAPEVEKPEGMPIHPGLHKPAANMLAVCSCGMLIKPSATTKYFRYSDKEYAMCSDYCVKNAEKDPAAAIKTIEKHMAEAMIPSPMK